MNEDDFWKLIEDLWDIVNEEKYKRMIIAIPKEYPENASELGKKFEDVMEQKVFPRLEKELRCMSKEESFSFNQILEKKLYDLDTREIHEYVEGSDDGFLYHRGFIVGMGKEYYYSILNDPSKGLLRLRSEDFAYMTRAIHHERFSDQENIDSFTEGISRETCSNLEGWKEDNNID